MKVYYSSNRQQKNLTDFRLLKKFYSNDFVNISNRLSELRAAENLNQIPEVPPPRRHKLQGDLQGCWGINYSRNNRIVIRPAGEFDINDLSTINQITIIKLEDYH